MTDFSSDKFSTGKEIKLPLARRTSIFIDTDENGVKFQFTNSENIVFKIIEGKLSKMEINEMSNLFGFNVIHHKYHPEILVGSLGFIHNDYDLACYFLIKKKLDKYFALLYARRGDSIFVNNILYIHGIWQVNVNEDFLSRIKS